MHIHFTGIERQRETQKRQKGEMGRFSSILKSPKKEEQQVPDNSVPESSETNDIYLSLNMVDEIDTMDELEDIWGIEDEQKLVGDGSTMRLLETDILDLDEFQIEKVDYKKKNITSQLLQEEEQMVTNVAKTEISGFWDDDEENLSVNLNLSLNYQEVMDAWSDRGSLWADECSLSAINNFMGEVPVMQEERTRREASVMRYKEKRQSRLFSNSKKIRYQVRKINAENRPRLKGRFVKSVQDKMHTSMTDATLKYL